MTTKTKWILGIGLIGLASVLGISFYKKRPTINIIPDWTNKSFKYNISVDGNKLDGEQKLSDKGITKYYGDYEFDINGGNQSIVSIWKKGGSHTLKSVVVDFDSKSIYSNGGARGNK